MSEQQLSPEWDEYLAVLREDAHQLLAWSYVDNRSRLAQADDEYEMTGLLADGMTDRIDSHMTDERFMIYSVHNEQPISPDGQLGKKRPRIDIRIERCGIRPKRYFTFEAKRLRDDRTSSVRDTMREYLGHEGIGRFIGGLYAAESYEAAMLGCMQARDAEFWFGQLVDVLSADAVNSTGRFQLVGKIEMANVIPEFPDERVSSHLRASGIPIQIFHVFIDCRSAAN
jgi:hypothetical protein